MPIQKPSPEKQREIDAHWARVRAGLHEPEAHVFKEDVSHLIEMHRFLARKCVEGAASHMRHVAELQEVV